VLAAEILTAIHAYLETLPPEKAPRPREQAANAPPAHKNCLSMNSLA
jgi:hypothetical protein